MDEVVVGMVVVLRLLRDNPDRISTAHRASCVTDILHSSFILHFATISHLRPFVLLVPKCSTSPLAFPLLILAV